MNDLSPAPGWHGKLPTAGDFVTRRLPADFVTAWDDWLSDGLAALARRPDWLDAYLRSPSWRFLLMPGALPGPLGQTGWLGVLMPSVDRVGRYYPLTLASPVSGLPAGGDALDAAWSWLLRLDEAAADALHDDWTVDALEEALERLGPPPPTRPTPSPVRPAGADAAPVAALPLEGFRHGAERLAAEARDAWAAQSRGLAYWYAEADLARPRLLRSEGLPRPGLVARLLGGVDDNASD